MNNRRNNNDEDDIFNENSSAPTWGDDSIAFPSNEPSSSSSSSFDFDDASSTRQAEWQEDGFESNNKPSKTGEWDPTRGGMGAVGGLGAKNTKPKTIPTAVVCGALAIGNGIKGATAGAVYGVFNAVMSGASQGIIR